MTSNAVSEVPFRAWRFPLERVPTNAQARFAYWEEVPVTKLRARQHMVMDGLHTPHVMPRGRISDPV